MYDIHYQGLLNTRHSFALVGSELVKSLDKLGCSLSTKSTNGTNAMDPRVEELLVKESNSDICLSYTVPPNIARLPGKYKAIIYNYETTKLPSGWADMLSASSVILPSSTFSRNILLKNGVPSNLMHVVPHGVDTSIYNPNVKPYDFETDKFVFLMISSPHYRKGFDLLFRAFAEEFASVEDVMLAVVTTDKINNSHFYVKPTEILKDLRQRLAFPEVRIIPSNFTDTAPLYRGAHCYVSPSRTETFGLTALEAQACGTPVIATRYGGWLDFLNDRNSFLIDYNEVFAPRPAQYWKYSPQGKMAEPKVSHLRTLMRYTFENYKDAQAKAKVGSEEIVPNFTWDKAAQKLVDALDKTKIPRGVKKSVNIISSKPRVVTPKVEEVSNSKKIESKGDKSIIYHVPMSFIGGAEMQLKLLVERLKDKHDITITYQSARVKDFVDSLGVRSKYVGSVKDLTSFIDNCKPDIVQFYHSKLMYDALKGCTHRPYIIELQHDTRRFLGDSLSYPKDQTDIMIAVSHDVEKFIKEHTTVKTQVITNGIDDELYSTRFKRDKTKPVTVGGYLGRLERGEGKGIPLLVNVARQFPEITFELVGDDLGNYREQLIGSNIKVLPRTDDPIKKLLEWDFFISTSPKEGFGLSIAEALALDTPTIALDCGGICKYLTHEQNILLAKDEKELYFYIKRVIEKRHNLRPRNVVFSADKMIQEYSQVYVKDYMPDKKLIEGSREKELLTPLVSVLMTAYNVENYIQSSVFSVLNQTYRNLEVLIVDDCSSDATLQKLLQIKDPRLKIFKNKENAGTYWSKNFLLTKARGKYITTQDGDDITTSNKIEIQVKDLERNVRAHVVTHRWRRIDSEGKELYVRNVSYSTNLYRRSVFEKLGFFDTVRCGADYEFWVRLEKTFSENEIIRRPEYLLTAIQRDEGLTSQISDSTRDTYISDFKNWHRSTPSLYMPFPLAKRKITISCTTIVGEGYKDPIHLDLSNCIQILPKQIPVIMCTWKRLDTLPRILDCLKDQTYQNFKLFIWNNNIEEKEKLERIVNQNKGDFEVEIKHSKENIGGFGRFFYAKKLKEQKYDEDCCIFIDDDFFFKKDMLATFLEEYRQESIISWWGWSFTENSFFKGRREVEIGDNMHYAGTGGMIIDKSICLKQELFDCPKEFWFIEDLWLSFIANKFFGWRIFKSKNLFYNIIDEQGKAVGQDKYALWAKLHKAKEDMMNYLFTEYKWPIIKEPKLYE